MKRPRGLFPIYDWASSQPMREYVRYVTSSLIELVLLSPRQKTGPGVDPFAVHQTGWIYPVYPVLVCGDRHTSVSQTPPFHGEFVSQHDGCRCPVDKYIGIISSYPTHWKDESILQTPTSCVRRNILRNTNMALKSIMKQYMRVYMLKTCRGVSNSV